MRSLVGFPPRRWRNRAGPMPSGCESLKQNLPADQAGRSGCGKLTPPGDLATVASRNPASPLHERFAGSTRRSLTSVLTPLGSGWGASGCIESFSSRSSPLSGGARGSWYRRSAAIHRRDGSSGGRAVAHHVHLEFRVGLNSSAPIQIFLPSVVRRDAPPVGSPPCRVILAASHCRLSSGHRTLEFPSSRAGLAPGSESPDGVGTTRFIWL